MWVKRILIFGICIAALLSGCGPEAPSSSRLAEVEATPSREATIPTPEPTFISPLPTLTPSPEPTVVVPLPTASPLPEPTEVYTDIISIPTTPTPIPTPDVRATTVPELDNIAFVNPRPLQLPDGIEHSAFGLIAWSPDGRQFLGNVISDQVIRIGNLGYAVLDLYLGNAETGQVTLLQRNAGWPAWSQDGRFFYYLAGHGDGRGVYYDLYRRAAISGEVTLIAEDVGAGGSESAVAEMADGRLVLWNREYQIALLNQGAVVPIATLADIEAMSGGGNYFSLAPDRHTVAIVSQYHPVYVVDLAISEIVAQLDAVVHFSDNAAWSPNSDRLAYATDNGVFTYDRQAGSVETVITGQDLGFSEQDIRSNFGTPTWSPSGDILLFSAGTPDWSYDSVGHRYMYLFAITSNGAHWKALARFFFDAVAPDGLQAIVTVWDPSTERETKYLVDIVWE